MLLLFSLSACSERNLEIGFLSKAIQGKTEFNVDNAIAEGDMLPDATESSIPMEISCSSTVNMVEVQNPQSKEWKQVTDLVPGLNFDCATTGKVSVAVPIDYAAPYVTPITSGDFRQDFQIRWKVKNLEGETSVYYRTLSALFKAPTVSTQALDINIAATNAGYTVSGNCSLQGGSVIVEGPFANGNITTTCTDGSYTAAADIDSAYPSGPVSIRAKHQKATDARAYGEAEKTVQIDVQTPTVSFTSPTQGRVFNYSDVGAANAITVQGSCSESLMDVDLYLNGTKVTTATCAVGLNFNANVVIPEGSFTLKAKHTDEAGNTGESIVLNLQKDVTPPGGFAIMGVRSSASVDDVTTDDLLTAQGLRVDLGTAADAVSYEAFVKDNTGTTTICPSQTSSSSYITFSCTLQPNITYKVYAQAKDVNGNTTMATNAAYPFTTQFPVPQIIRIYSDVTSNATYKAGQQVPIFVEFSRAISFTGSIALNLNTGGSVGSPTLVASGTTLRFNYIVSSGQYAAPLGVNSMDLNGGRIYDANNTVVDANAIPATDTGANSSYLKSRNIKIDAQNPDPVTGLTLGPIPSRIFDSPTVSFGLPSDPDPVSVTIRIVRDSDGVEMVGWSQSGSGVFFNMSSNVTLGTNYRVQVKVLDPVGNESTISQVLFTSFNCPASDLAYVYNPAASSVGAFCVGKFEAKNSLSSPQFIATGTPLIGISQMDAVAACQNRGSKYKVITNQQWNALADLIRQQPGNWSGGSVESGILYRGNTILNVTPAAANTADPCSPTDATICGDQSARRRFVLPYGQEVWDIAGNAWEVTRETDNNSDTGYSPSSGYVSNLAWVGGQLRALYGTSNSCPAPSSGDYCGYGKLDFSLIPSAGSNIVIWRGGTTYQGRDAGVFAGLRAGNGGSSVTNGGFRCVYEP
ncbi:Ig-like domain-containing protein [Bdellovibrio bacteriovorus]|uniref:Ig-like domain-containing protein n=1 Tax=Bdellovibrio TaxID=958 RepID=UPI0035A94D54